VPLAVYDQTLRVFRSAVTQAKLGNADKLGALARLDEQSRLCEAAAEGRALPSLPGLMAEERAAAAARGGRTVVPATPARPRQLRLF
jgi:hypothetical protein